MRATESGLERGRLEALNEWEKIGVAAAVCLVGWESWDWEAYRVSNERPTCHNSLVVIGQIRHE